MEKSGYQDLIVWKKALELATEIYRLTRFFPKEETYGITSQMRRAALSIPSNIAEGSQRERSGDFDYFLRIAKGSSAELETQLLIAERLGYIQDFNLLKRISDLLIEIRKMLFSLASKL